MIEISAHCLAWNNKELCVLIISVVFTSFINIGCPCIANIPTKKIINSISLYMLLGICIIHFFK